MSRHQQRHQVAPETPNDLRPILVHLSSVEMATLLPLRDAHRVERQDPHATIGDAIRAALAAAYRGLVGATA